MQTRTPPDAPNVDRIVFLHIAKTAGTSIVEFFRREFGADAVISHGDFLAHGAGDVLPAEVVRGTRLVSGHFGFAQVEPYLEGAYSFTFLRDPVERVLSLYQFCQHADMQARFAVARAAGKLGLEGWLESQLPEVVEMLDNQQTWQLARMYWAEDRAALAHLDDEALFGLARDHLDRLSRVGLTETFDADFRRILADLGLPDPGTVPRELVTPSRPLQGQLSSRTLNRLRRRLSLDFRLYDHVRSTRAHEH